MLVALGLYAGQFVAGDERLYRRDGRLDLQECLALGLHPDDRRLVVARRARGRDRVAEHLDAAHLVGRGHLPGGAGVPHHAGFDVVRVRLAAAADAAVRRSMAPASRCQGPGSWASTWYPSPGRSLAGGCTPARSCTSRPSRCSRCPDGRRRLGQQEPTSRPRAAQLRHLRRQQEQCQPLQGPRPMLRLQTRLLTEIPLTGPRTSLPLVAET